MEDVRGATDLLQPVVRQISAEPELRRLVSFQCQAWGFPPDDAVPSNYLLAATRTGGLVLGAYGDSDELLGFSFTAPAFNADGPYQYLHMIAARPDCLGRGVGEALLRTHARCSLEAGVQKVTWTYDPLEARNAALYLHKAGATVEKYERDYYGQSRSLLHAGLPSDRVIAIWRPGSARVQERLFELARPDIDVWQARGAEFVDDDSVMSHHALPRHFFAPVPNDIQRLKTDTEAACRWSLKSRNLLERHLVGCGGNYQIVDFVSSRSGETDERRNFYVLEKVER